MKMTVTKLKYDCREFRGDVPCRPHKEHGVHCVEAQGKVCRYYDPVKERILIIKLGAIGDVIRTTPVLARIRKEFVRSEIWWLTMSPEVLPEMVDVPLKFDAQSLAILQAVRFDLLINLDKDRLASGLCLLLDAKDKMGFTLKNGRPFPINKDAHHKYLTGVFDDIGKANLKSYQEEIFEMCGYRFKGEEYIMPGFAKHEWGLPDGKIIVGLNTGCGGRWVSRLWPDGYWVSLAKKLKKAGYLPLFLGGEQEHEKNRRLAAKSGGVYLGHFPLKHFMDLVDRCDLVVTSVTMAMHIAIGLRKKLLLFNNIFNKNEFELYGRGEIIEPDFECDCFYRPTCPNNCMQYLSVQSAFEGCMRLLKGISKK